MGKDDKIDLLHHPGLLDLLLQGLSVGVWILDRKGNIVHANPEAQKIWAGARYVGVEGYGEYKGWWRGTGKRLQAEDWSAARALKSGETILNEEVEIECFDGTRKIILNSSIPVRGETGEILGVIAVNVDITDRVRLEDRLRAAAEIDELTGLLNRRRFYELMREEVQRATRYQRPLSMVMFDIDRFKQINDTHGHAVGDQVLVYLSRQVRSDVRDTEHLARIGGDEFMLLLPETRLEDAVRTARRIQKMLADRPLEPVGPIACSYGVSEFQPGETLDDLTRRADKALYQAKGAGRGRVMTADGERPTP